MQTEGLKDGVYINTFRDTANIVVIENGEFDDGDAVDIFSYSLDLNMKNNSKILKVIFSKLDYLGEL